MQLETPLTPRWTPMRPHPEQSAYSASTARHNVIPAGRRSGKTELAKRKLVLRALLSHDESTPYHVPFPNPRFFVAAPTYDQVRLIFWDDLRALIPKDFMSTKPNASSLLIRLVNGATIRLFGMDRPERIEGPPWDGGILDEFGNMKPEAWGEHVQPVLADRKGWCDFIGVPEGRNHYYDLWTAARGRETKARREGREPVWRTFHWLSSDILPPEEIEKARQELDEITFRQEYEGSFESFAGRAYYSFDSKVHCRPLPYDSRVPLIFCFDFNVSPGVAVVAQEQELAPGVTGTAVIGEVWIERHSNTPLVCKRLLEDWGDHQADIYVYGDPSGAASGSARLESDWEMIKRFLRGHYSVGPRPREPRFRVPKAAPAERDRVNAVNSRLRSASGVVRLAVDPSRAPHVVKDFEGVVTVKGGSGEIEKKPGGQLTHLTDALGYYIHREYPLRKQYARRVNKHWK